MKSVKNCWLVFWVGLCCPFPRTLTHSTVWSTPGTHCSRVWTVERPTCVHRCISDTPSCAAIFWKTWAEVLWRNTCQSLFHISEQLVLIATSVCNHLSLDHVPPSSCPVWYVWEYVVARVMAREMLLNHGHSNGQGNFLSKYHPLWGRNVQMLHCPRPQYLPKVNFSKLCR